MRNNKKVRFINSAFILVAILGLMSFSVSAQETQETVVDEVIAQINDDVITLSQINRELKFTVDSLIQQGKTREEAETFVEGQKGQLIANIINEELMIQKGKEVGLDKEVEIQINQRFRKQMEDNNFKSLDELYTAMRAQGIEPDEIRNVWKTQIMRDLVWSELVDKVVYFEITDKEIKDYYAKYPEKFKKEATVTISEIFLSFAGKDETAVKEKAAQIVERARKGEEFAKLAVENSDRPNVAETKGAAGTFNLPQLDKLFAEPLEKLKVGGVTDPIIMDEGIEILHVDERTAASDESSFNENAVRQAIWKEKAPDARKKFMKDLKTDSYIKIRDSYRPIVTPFLNADPAAEKDESTASN